MISALSFHNVVYVRSHWDRLIFTWVSNLLCSGPQRYRRCKGGSACVGTYPIPSLSIWQTGSLTDGEEHYSRLQLERSDLEELWSATWRSYTGQYPFIVCVLFSNVDLSCFWTDLIEKILNWFQTDIKISIFCFDWFCSFLYWSQWDHFNFDILSFDCSYSFLDWRDYRDLSCDFATKMFIWVDSFTEPVLLQKNVSHFWCGGSHQLLGEQK